ncbi:MAG: hypothetical protein ACTHMS_09195 [Jatrophihabitans sp.]|uniref:hypothetical protein n=1 Tax=Jatrophihabitans sp. TaxID=1932789 RepID=UPI003F82155A
MTQVLERPSAAPSPPAPTWRRLGLPLLVTALHAVLFVVIQPEVPDLEAALARGEAAAHGVGLTYWFQWFGGGSPPAQYSVLSPWLSAWLTAPVVGALATLACTPLADRLLVRTAHRSLGVWVTVATAGCSLWSGRIAFALGAAFALVALVGMRERRPVVAVVGVLGAAASSPVAAAFLAVGLGAAGLTDPKRRRLAWTLGAVALATLGTVAVLFGSPGPATFRLPSVLGIVGCGVLLLLARPHRAVRMVVVATVVAAPVVMLVPNGLGSSLGRLAYIALPVAVAATASVSRRFAVLLVAPAVVAGGLMTVHDVRVATRPAAEPSYYDGLRAELLHVRDLPQYRLEVVQSRSFHTASYALLDRAALATGWETQTLNRYDAVLTSARLDASRYRSWLDDNAVGYLAFDRRSPDRIDREYLLVAHGLGYLRPVWRDATWTLYRVSRPTPIVAAPARLLTATQSTLTFRSPCACTVHVRVRYSEYLDVDRGGTIAPAPDGWTVLSVPAPGTYELAGE